jgi:hypothetical protein
VVLNARLEPTKATATQRMQRKEVCVDPDSFGNTAGACVIEAHDHAGWHRLVHAEPPFLSVADHDLDDVAEAQWAPGLACLNLHPASP